MAGISNLAGWKIIHGVSLLLLAVAFHDLLGAAASVGLDL
jgi:hypothetical protein